jgi:hypothetical protein
MFTTTAVILLDDRGSNDFKNDHARRMGGAAILPFVRECY